MAIEFSVKKVTLNTVAIIGCIEIPCKEVQMHGICAECPFRNDGQEALNAPLLEQWLKDNQDKIKVVP